MSTSRSWQDLDGDRRLVSSFENVLQLGLHDGQSANGAPENFFFEDDPQSERILGPGELGLPGHTELDQLIDCLTGVLRPECPQHGPGVVFGLEQSVHELRLIRAD